MGDRFINFWCGFRFFNRIIMKRVDKTCCEGIGKDATRWRARGVGNWEIKALAFFTSKPTTNTGIACRLWEDEGPVEKCGELGMPAWAYLLRIPMWMTETTGIVPYDGLMNALQMRIDLKRTGGIWPWRIKLPTFGKMAVTEHPKTTL